MKFSINNVNFKEIENLLKVWQITSADQVPVIDVALAEFNSGRYPKSGTARNVVSTMVYIVKEGRAQITVDKVVYAIEKGDVLVILPDKKYFIEPERGFRIYIISTPAWNPVQYIVE